MAVGLSASGRVTLSLVIRAIILVLSNCSACAIFLVVQCFGQWRFTVDSVIGVECDLTSQILSRTLVAGKFDCLFFLFKVLG
jgi:hypothetical protein